ncbi:hypothetical protein KVR01_007964 [Diaporthe batatas]|uniref:uncharacterized protein n=1 Tax=Diaporthe batatas TaxID=748121 RepID=UPI001D058322|nr:uncharacterized protein KVR01_007964 [Diaporthe batatas]KAG8162199.1 hypothetical protein KVR01_007964 [Diaporthe batatas]
MGAHDAGIRLIDTRHETVAVQAAEGYAKVKNQVGVCFFTANSGFGNALAGLSTAMADRSPIFCITSSAPQRDAELNVLQGFHDQVVVSKPIPRLVSHAFHMATAGPTGPVLIDFPIDVLFSPVDPKRIAWGSVRMKPSYPAAPHPEATQKAVEMISAAKRPVIITGAGARGLEEDTAFHDFVAKAQIPTFNSTEYSGALPNKHPLRGGLANLLNVLQMINHPAPDLVLLLGARTGFFLGSRGSPCIPHPDECQYIQVDTDSGEIGRAHDIHLGITSDPKAAMDALSKGLNSVNYTAPADWVKTTMSLKAGPMPQEQDAEEYEPGRVHPYHALKRAFSSLPGDATLSIDGGEVASWSLMTSEFLRPKRMIFSCGYLGFLGNGWGYSLGASIAEPDRLVVNIQGDGSGGMHLAELDTYARFGAKVLTIVCNNHCWGMSVGGQEIIYGAITKSRPAAILSQEMKFSTVAEGLGSASERVSKPADIDAAVKRLAESALSGKPALLEIITSSHPIHPGTIAMVGNTDDKNVIVVPYYDNVPRPHYN